MKAIESIDTMRTHAIRHVEALKGLVPKGATLVVIELAECEPFTFDVSGLAIGHQVKGRTFFASLTPKVLSWRARQVAGEAEVHELFANSTRAVLVVQNDGLTAIVDALKRDIQALRDATGDTLIVDVAQRPLPLDALASTASRPFCACYNDFIDTDLRQAACRRAEGATTEFWTPSQFGFQGDPWAELGHILFDKLQIKAIGVAASSAGCLPLGLEMRAGGSVQAVVGDMGVPRLVVHVEPRGLLSGDGDEAGEGDEVMALAMGGTWRGFKADKATMPQKLAMLRMDLDGVRAAFGAVTEGKSAEDALRDWLVLRQAIDLICSPAAVSLASSKEAQQIGTDQVEWLQADADGLLVLGSWSGVVKMASVLRDAIVPFVADVVRALGGDAMAKVLDVSAGLVMAPDHVPLALVAERTRETLRCAKSERLTRSGGRKRHGALGFGDVAVGWADYRLVVELGLMLGRAIFRRQIPRSVVRRLAGIHELYRRSRVALDLGGVRDAAATNKRRWLWSHALGQLRTGLDEEGQRVMRRLSRLALENVDEGLGGVVHRTEQEAAAWLSVVAEIAQQAMLLQEQELT